MFSVVCRSSLLGRGVTVAARCLSRDIGQPTHFTHPELLVKDEGM